MPTYITVCVHIYPLKILRNFHSCTIESVLMGNITACSGNSTEQDRKALQRVVHSAERIIGSTLPCIKDILHQAV